VRKPCFCALAARSHASGKGGRSTASPAKGGSVAPALQNRAMDTRLQTASCLLTQAKIAWALLPHVLWYYAPLRLPRVRLGSLGFRSLPNTLSAPLLCVPSAGSLAAGSWLLAPGLLLSRYPCSSGLLGQGAPWLSPVPEFPL
jgi:hypothetical protein